MAKLILKIGRQPNSGAEQKVKSCTGITAWTLESGFHLEVFTDGGCLLTAPIMACGRQLAAER